MAIVLDVVEPGFPTVEHATEHICVNQGEPQRNDGVQL
jgi:hypothetical protein